MEAGIQGALSILSTICGPSPVLDGLVDQIIQTGLPMVPTLMASAHANGQPQSPDATARMLLNGVQRASEHVSPQRKVAIVRGIATHVCPSDSLPWAVRAFAVKNLQSIIQNHFKGVDEVSRAEAVGAAVEAIVYVIQTAHIVELAKHLKITGESNPAIAAMLAATNPFHNAEVKSAAEFFAFLTEIDADTVASVFAPKQKAHMTVIGEMIRIAAEEQSSNAAAAAAAPAPAATVAQAVMARYDLIALGLPRTASLRPALEKLNCVVLSEVSKELADSLSAEDGFDVLLAAFGRFFFSHHNNHPKTTAIGAVAAAAAAEEKRAEGGEEPSTATATHEESGDGSAAESATPTAAPIPPSPAAPTATPANAKVVITIADTLYGLTTEQNVSRETVMGFIRTELKAATGRVGAELAAAVSPDTLSLERQLRWRERLGLLSRYGLHPKPNTPMVAELSEVLFGLLRCLSLAVTASKNAKLSTPPVSDAAVSLVREIYFYIQRAVTSLSVNSHSVYNRHHFNNNNNNNNNNHPHHRLSNAAVTHTATTLHTRCLDGVSLLLKALLPESPIPAVTPANTLPAENGEISADGPFTAANLVSRGLQGLNLPLLEVSHFILSHCAPKPRREKAKNKAAATNATATTNAADDDAAAVSAESTAANGAGDSDICNAAASSAAAANVDTYTAAETTAGSTATAEGGEKPQGEEANEEESEEEEEEEGEVGRKRGRSEGDTGGDEEEGEQRQRQESSDDDEDEDNNDADADAARDGEGEAAAAASSSAVGGDNAASEEDGAANTSSTASKASPKKKTSSYVTVYGSPIQEYIITVCRGGFVFMLQCALKAVAEEIGRIDVANKMKALLGDKAPAEVLEGLSNGGPYLTFPQLQYRQRVLQNIIGFTRQLLNILKPEMIRMPSYRSPNSSSAAMSAGDHHHHHNHHHANRNHTNSNNSHAPNNNNSNNNSNYNGNRTNFNGGNDHNRRGYNNNTNSTIAHTAGSSMGTNLNMNRHHHPNSSAPNNNYNTNNNYNNNTNNGYKRHRGEDNGNGGTSSGNTYGANSNNNNNRPYHHNSHHHNNTNNGGRNYGNNNNNNNTNTHSNNTNTNTHGHHNNHRAGNNNHYSNNNTTTNNNNNNNNNYHNNRRNNNNNSYPNNSNNNSSRR